ncbi:hypothetical protein DFH09DRAFT_478332 [Mycena vulgaris]|nr:hypothetical protein DFH09DRAFT_478332 [Mycena vulgaris]
MAEFFGLVASILQLVDTVAKAHHYITDFHDAPKDQQRLLWEIKSLEPLVRKLDNQIRKDQAAGLLSGLREFKESLGQLKGIMERLTKKVDPTGISKLAGRLAWPLWGKEDVEDGLNAIERFKSLLNAWLGMDILNFTQDIVSSLQDVAEEQRVDLGYLNRSVKHFTQEHRVAHDQTLSNFKDLKDAAEENRIDHKYIAQSVRNVAKHQKQYHESAERDKIIEWFSPLNFFLRQADIFSSREPGTGQWFLEHELFKKWKTGSTKMLWCPGMPGSGKTVLSSIVVNDLRAHLDSQNTGVAVLYLNHKETEAQAPSNLLAGLWRQLIFEKPISSVYQLYAKHREQRTRPSLADTDSVLRSIVSEYSRVFIIADALDEYPEALRHALLRRFSAFGPTVNLMLTSRHHINILPICESYDTLEVRANADDIREYVDAQILKFSRLAKHLKNCPDLKEEIETKIVQGSDGMFLLAKLHIDSLTTKMTVKAVRAALNNLMGDLDSTYSEVVERINRQSEDERNLAWLVLSWITNAQRPLRPAELREALAVESAAPFLDPDNLLDIETILAACAGLVIVDEADNLVRLIHYTTHDYLERIQADAFPRAQTEIASVCITYLSFDVFSSKIDDRTKRLFPNSLLDYCVDYCLTHARGQPESDIRPLILSFLKNCSAWRKFWNWRHSFEKIPGAATPLWVAAVFRLGEICRHLIQEEGTGGLLQEASLQGLADVVRILVENGASVDTNEGEYDSPLQAASVSGHDEIIGLLLTHGANINLQGTRYGTALELAAFFGHKSSVGLLIDGGANVNAAGGRYGTALYAAAGGAQGDEEIIRLLLKHGAAVNGKGGHYGTALRASIYRGANGIARVLLEHGADIHAEQIISANMLQRAISKGHNAIARLLVEYGAAINKKGAACLLVEYGAAINEKGTACTALDVAACCCNTDLNKSGRPEDAVRFGEEAVEIWRRIVETDPTAIQRLAQSLHTLGINLSNVGRLEDAVRVDEEAVEIYRRLAETDPTAIGKLAESLHSLDFDLSNVGHYEDAVRIGEEAVEIWRRIVETDPTAIQRLAQSLHTLGINLTNVGRHEDAVPVDQEAVEICRMLAGKDPTVTEILAICLLGLACDLRLIGCHQDALALAEEVVGLCRALAGDSRTRLADSLQNMGFDLHAAQRFDDAVCVLEEAVGIYQELAELSVTTKLKLANALQTLAAFQHAAGRVEDALCTYEKGAVIHRKLGETDPDETANFLHDLAVNFRSIGLHDGVLRAEKEAVALYHQLVQTKPAFRVRLATCLKLLAADLRTLGREDEAARTDVEVATLNTMPTGQAPSSAPGADMSQRLLTTTAGHEIVDKVGDQDEEGERDSLRAR